MANWSVQIPSDGVARPGLNEIRVRFFLMRDGVDHAGGLEVIVLASDLQGKTANQKRNFVLQAIKAKALPYVLTDAHLPDLLPLDGQTIDPTA